MTRRRSNTLGNKIKQQDNSIQKQHYQLVNEQPILHKIMIKKNKCTFFIQIQNNILGDKLFQILQNQTYISQDKQIIFLKGERIIPSRWTWMKNFSFFDKDILHLHNKDLVNRQPINITLAFLNTQYIKYIQRPLTARPDENIRLALQQILILQLQDVDQSMYVQSGRFININSTFRQQCIQDGSIILVMPNKNNPSILKILQQREIELIASRTKLIKRTSLIALDNIIQTPNFKKKQKSNIYKAILIPESKQIIWQQDTNSQTSKMALKKTIIKKKKTNISSIKIFNWKQNFSNLTNHGNFQRQFKTLENSILPKVNNRKQPLNEGKNLSLSACLFKNRQIKEKPMRQPPKMQIQAIQAQQQVYSSSEDSQQSQQNGQMQLQNNRMKNSAPLNSLKKSVGGFRNQFIPPIMSISPPILLNNDDEEEQFQDF